MAWQFWVVVGLVAAGVVILTVITMRHAQNVFDDITRPDASAESGWAGPQ